MLLCSLERFTYFTWLVSISLALVHLTTFSHVKIFLCESLGLAYLSVNGDGEETAPGGRRDLAAESRSLPPSHPSVVPSSVRVRPSLWRGRRPPRRGCVGGFEAANGGGGGDGEEVNGGRARRHPMELFKREGPGIGRKGRGQRMTDRGSRNWL